MRLTTNIATHKTHSTARHERSEPGATVINIRPGPLAPGAASSLLTRGHEGRGTWPGAGGGQGRRLRLVSGQGVTGVWSSLRLRGDRAWPVQAQAEGGPVETRRHGATLCCDLSQSRSQASPRGKYSSRLLLLLVCFVAKNVQILCINVI